MRSPQIHLQSSDPPVERGHPDWVGPDGYFHPLDYWLRLCGLYALYAYAVRLLGELRGRVVLDAGCGKGHTSVMLARRGATVEAFDVSGPELSIAQRLAAANGADVRHRALIFEEMDYPDATFDLAFGACVLHHVQIPTAMAQLSRVLKPGGKAAFVENSARNPLLMMARRYLVGRMGIPRYGDDHEHPLRAADFDTMRRHFAGTVTVHYPEFVFFRLVDFYVLGERSRWMSKLLRGLDAGLGKLPWIREFGYFLVVELERNQQPWVESTTPTPADDIRTPMARPQAALRTAGVVATLAATALVAGCVEAQAKKNEFALSSDRAAASCRQQVKLPAARTREAADAIKVLPPANGIYAGVYSIGTTRADVKAFERKTGKPPALVFTFHDWISDDDFASKHPTLRTFRSDMEDRGITPIELAQQLSAQGSVLAVTWAIQCCDWGSTAWWFGLRETQANVNRLLRGDFDDYVRKVAGEVKSLGKPIMLALFSEFNWQGAMAFGRDGKTRISEADDICGQYGDPGWPDGPERIRDAHMHVIDLFRREGVKNVTWFMYANSGYMDTRSDDYSPWLHPRYFYPGDAYIDWVGQSTYFIDPRWKSSPSEDAAVMAQALMSGYQAWGEVTQRPLFLPEFGAVGDKKLDRAPILREVMTEVLPKLPRVRAFTLADFLIAEICCQTPRLGEGHAGEIDAWRNSVGDNPTYVFKVQTGPPVERKLQ